VLGERHALERAAANLVRNARRHGPPDGRIAVTVDHDGDRARLTVADEGPGLSPGEAAHAFERFWRGASARGEGSGLGLAIVRAIAERHGGSVRVDGARFTIELPALEEARHSQASFKDQPYNPGQHAKPASPEDPA
jgi:two-component system OmpR family sensor kinase